MLACLVAVAAPPALGAQGCPQGTLPAYSHNDYQNTRPLLDALHLGYRGVEVDVFLVDGTLRVGHDRKAARKGETLEELYLIPLVAIATRCPRLTVDILPFMLAVEVKEESAATHQALVHLLERFRILLEPRDSSIDRQAPVTVVLVGWHPPVDSARGVGALLAHQHRLRNAEAIARGVPLDSRVRLLSLDYGKTMGRWWVTAAGKRRWLAALRAAKARAPDQILRVHNVPVDARIYAALLDAGVDLIGTKQIHETLRALNRHGPPPSRSP